MGARPIGRQRTACKPFVAIEKLENRRLLSATWYVATTGKDSNPGTLAAPFQTIQHAANIAHAGDTVFIRGGTYHETVEPANSGTAAAPITFSAYQSETVTISGADPITGWSLVPGTSATYAATRNWDMGNYTNQLFVDGQMMNMARSPNPSGDPERLSTYTIQSVSATSTTATITDKTNLNQPANYWKGAYIQIGAGADWFQQTAMITASGPGFISFSYTPVTSQPQYNTPVVGNHYFLFGIARLLDSPGEWVKDPVSGKVLLIPPKGVNPATHDVEAKHRNYAVDVSGRSYITITGINIFSATINSDSASSHLVINKLNASYLTHWLLQPTGHAPNTSTGIALNGAHDLIENSRITYSAGDGVFLGGAGSRVTNCIITDTDYSGSDAAPIRVYASGCEIDHCTISQAAQDGIILRATGAKILNNDIHDCGLQCNDVGGIYAIRQDGTGGEIAYNHIYNVTTGGFGGSGIQLDDYCNNFTVDHNVTWNVDDALKITYNSFDDRIYNNTFDANGLSVQRNSTADWTGTRIENNIFFATANCGVNATISNNLNPPNLPRCISRSGHNYQLQSISPVIDKGLVIPPFTNGYTGAAPDLGAYEYGVKPFAVGAVL